MLCPQKLDRHGFKVSESLADRLEFASGDVTLAAHSLGNMVASNAIAHEGMNVTRYYMINAATPLEAYNPDQRHDDPSHANRMIHTSWKEYWNSSVDHSRVFATHWHELFPGSDNRSKVTWGGLFADATGVAYNFYSSGEDVVENAGANESVLTNYVSVVGTKIGSEFTNRGGGVHAWTAQEIVKGNATLIFPTGALSQEAGWDFNSELFKRGDITSVVEGVPIYDYTRRTAQDLTDNPLSDEQLAQIGFFDRFDERNLYGPISDGNVLSGNSVTQSQSSNLLNQSTEEGKELLYKLLSTAIPSRSYAAAANPSDELDDSQNINLQGLQDGYPQAAIDFDYDPDDPNNGYSNGRWRHSDFKDISYLYVYPFFKEMIKQGSLNQ